MYENMSESEHAGLLAETLCENEGNVVTLRFNDGIRAPTSRYNGRSYEVETLEKATLEAKIGMASIEDLGENLMCTAEISLDELERVGLRAESVYTEEVDGEEKCIVDINGTRKWWLDEEYDDVTIEEVEEAIEDGCEDEVLPPWDAPISVTVRVERTEECLVKSYNSGFYAQYSPPEHELGELMDIRT